MAATKKSSRQVPAEGNVDERQQTERHFSLFTEFDIALFKAGRHYKLYEKLGSHIVAVNGVAGTYFSVWAPNAAAVSVTGNFNGWNRYSHPMNIRWDGSGIWEVFIPGAGHGAYYKYYIESGNGYKVEKGDPYAIHWETPPHTASVIWECDFNWTDKKWVKARQENNRAEKPISIYEVHIGSWRRVSEGGT
jgi:1,4-alpha-glucan branching enzyme